MRGLTNLGGGGGLTAEEHEWLENVGKMPNFADINPNKLTGICRQTYSGSNGFVYIPVTGYDVISLYMSQGQTGTSYNAFVDASDTVVETVSITTNTWVDKKIPSGAVFYRCKSSSSSSWTYLDFAMFTADSPYNPDNQ